MHLTPPPLRSGGAGDAQAVSPHIQSKCMS